jgi:hypothetical protein
LIKALLHRANASADQIDHAFLSVLSRHPTDRELQRAATLLEGNPEGAQDLVWALINTSEFLFRQ